MNTTDIKSFMLFNRARTCDYMHVSLSYEQPKWFSLFIGRWDSLFSNVKFNEVWSWLSIRCFSLIELCQQKGKHLQLSWSSHTATLKVTGVRRCCTCSLSRSNQMQSVRTINGHQTTEMMWVLLHSLRQCCFMRNLDFRIWGHRGLFTASLYLVTQQQATSLCHVSDLFNIQGLLPGDKHREQQFNLI